MWYGILTVLLILMFFAWLSEKREGIAALRAAKRYRSELEDERRWSDQMCKERNDVIKKCIELEKLSVDKVFADWERIEDVSGVRDYYLEKDGMRIIIEDGKATSGFYSKEGPGEYVKPVAEVVQGSEV